MIAPPQLLRDFICALGYAACIGVVWIVLLYIFNAA